MRWNIHWVKLRIREIIKTLIKKSKKFKATIKYGNPDKKNTFWLSLGENCLSDDILRRHGRKSYSSIFSSGRSNIDYAIQLEKDNYNNLLFKENLEFGEINGTKIIRSTYYKSCDNLYSQLHMNGFEFTHHNPIDFSEDRRTFARRITRLKKTRGRKDFVFLYHHRCNENTDIKLIIGKLKEFREYYVNDKASATIILLYQKIIDKIEKKTIEFKSSNDGVLEFVCHTHDLWGGDDLDLFWAKNDDFLFSRMFSLVDARLNEFTDLDSIVRD